MNDHLKKLLEDNPRLLILGFGKEGQSTYRLLRKLFPEYPLGIADQISTIAIREDLKLDRNLELFLGQNYLDAINNFDLIIKSPGISLNKMAKIKPGKITSQTDIFLELYSKQTIGVTGTKGKSTTVSLIFHFLKNSNKNTVLLGNIGVPPFDKLDEINEETLIVFEMSAHQLEYLHHSPHIAVLLNVFPEHLDHFNQFDKYFSAKKNIFRLQKPNDVLIIEESLKESGLNILSKCKTYGEKPGQSASIVGDQIIFKENNFKFNLRHQEIPIKGEHNLNNLMAAMLAVCEVGVEFEQALNTLPAFKPLPHRLEYIGNFGGIDFYNDSISTVPESSIAALKTLPKTDTIILGGFDRGLDYTVLIDFIHQSAVKNLIFLGKAGDKMIALFKADHNLTRNIFRVADLNEAFTVISQNAKDMTTCLLSPAAASYDQFHNFEHRGDVFKELARNFKLK